MDDPMKVRLQLAADSVRVQTLTSSIASADNKIRRRIGRPIKARNSDFWAQANSLGVLLLSHRVTIGRSRQDSEVRIVVLSRMGSVRRAACPIRFGFGMS